MSELKVKQLHKWILKNQTLAIFGGLVIGDEKLLKILSKFQKVKKTK